MDVSNNPELYWLICTNNNIKKLDLSNNALLFSSDEYAYVVDPGVQIVNENDKSTIKIDISGESYKLEGTNLIKFSVS